MKGKVEIKAVLGFRMNKGMSGEDRFI